MTRKPLLLVNRTQLAALLGVSGSHLGRLIAAGMPERRAGGGPGRRAQHDAIDCLRWCRLQRLEVGSPNGASSARDHYLELLTDRVRQELAEKRGLLVLRETVLLAGQHYTRAWTAKVWALPHRLVERGLITREQVEAVRGLCREILTEIASWKTVEDCRRAARNTKGKKR